jgi:putative colanic acid biosynthesis acetyltransferase WcaF
MPDLARYRPGGFKRGRPAVVLGLWIVADALLVSSWLPGSWHRRVLLRAFGAQIGRGVVIKPRVRVKYPWRLAVGGHAWIGEDVWIDNLEPVVIGANACLSQGAYLCTGSHDWSRATFDLTVAPITVKDGGWVAAKAVVGPGVTIGEGAVLGLGSVATKNVASWTVNRGNPAQCMGERR